MKISAMNNNQASKALIRLADPIAHIMTDKTGAELTEEFSKMKDGTAIEAVGALLPRFVAFALKDHKDDLYEIIGALSDVEDVGNMNFLETVKILRESIDKDFLDFFKSPGNVTSKLGNS